jgi:hypothetical protein
MNAHESTAAKCSFVSVALLLTYSTVDVPLPLPIGALSLLATIAAVIDDELCAVIDDMSAPVVMPGEVTIMLLPPPPVLFHATTTVSTTSPQSSIHSHLIVYKTIWQVTLALTQHRTPDTPCSSGQQ